jgi:hypothetical protein
MAITGGEISSKELLEAQTHLWNHIFSFMNSFSLKTAVELGIPDAVHNHGKPITLTELAAAVSIPSARLDHFRRLMTLLVHNGFFSEATSATGEPLYSLTTNSLLLITEKGVSITPIIETVLYQPLLDPWQHLTPWLQSEQPSSAFELCHGLFFWDATGKMPELGKIMREGLDSDSAAVAKVIIQDCADQFQGVKTLVEVAGNKGKIAQAIAQAFPQIKCSLLELPHVINAIEKSDLIEYVAGDMFEHIPPADVLVLKWVLMTWNDEECVKILKRCKEAIPTKENGGKAIIIDKVMDVSPDGVHPKLTDIQLYFDMQMLVHVTGKQRIEAEWKKLFDEAGFKEYRIIPALGMRCIIEIYH